MEALNLLEEKVNTLVELVYELRAKNTRLMEEIAQLTAEKQEIQERLTLEKVEYSQVLSKEKELTKFVVDDLIKSIDSLTESASQR